MSASTLSLIVGTVACVMAVCGVVPTRFQIVRYLIGPYWALSWLSQTLAPQLIAITVAMLVLLFAVDAEHSAGGITGMMLSGLAILLWALTWHRACAIESTLARALEGLVAPSATRLVTDDRAMLRRVLPWVLQRNNVERIADLSYGPHGLRNQLDLYRPAGGGNKLPILIQIHGGAWVIGHKHLMGLPLTYHMAANGWMVVDINYRLGPTSRFPAMLEDVLRTIAWVREHACDFGGDPTFIALSGGSAGGHLAALAGLTQDRSRFQPGFESADTAVQAIVPFYGRYDFLDRDGWVGHSAISDFLIDKVLPCRPDEDATMWAAASPLDQVHAGAPPCFFLHGTHDCMTPVQEAREIVSRLRRCSRQPVLYAELFGAQHAFDLWHCRWTDLSVRAVHRFLNHLHSALKNVNRRY